VWKFWNTRFCLTLNIFKKKSKKVFLSITKPTTVYSKPQIARKDFHYKSRPEYDILVIFSSQLMRGGHLEHRPIIKQREERVQENQWNSGQNFKEFRILKASQSECADLNVGTDPPRGTVTLRKRKNSALQLCLLSSVGSESLSADNPCEHFHFLKPVFE
jgi:hypothetical protein